MLKFISDLIILVFFIYGIFTVIQDYINCKIYKKVEKNIKFIMTVKNVEDGIEEYIRDLTNGRNFYNNLVVIDLDSDDETLEILKRIEKEKFNMKVLDKNEGKEYLRNKLY